jgi:hypothetical protein
LEYGKIGLRDATDDDDGASRSIRRNRWSSRNYSTKFDFKIVAC